MADNVSRRNLALGVAWAVPVVVAAGAAPAFAASCGATRATYTMPFKTSTPNSYTRTKDSSGGRTGRASATSSQSGSTPVTVSVTSTGGSIMANNLTAAGDTTGGYNGAGVLGSDGLQLQQVPNGSPTTNPQRVTVTFSRPVTNLTFTITDLDRLAGQYYDNVTLTGTFTASLGSALQGTGTPNSPWRTGSTAGVVNSDATTNMVTVTYPGPLTSFTLAYWTDVSQTAGTTGMQVFLTGMSFSAASC